VRRRKPVTDTPRRFSAYPMTAGGDRGSASLWVVAGGVLVLLVALVAVLRGSAVLARERAEAAADLAALAAADGIGVDGSSVAVCARATVIAAANKARVVGCAVRLGADGRTGTVDVTVAVRVRLVGVGATSVQAHARAGRLAWASPTGSASSA
jgi:secretion/DNA translocation related TadE-like protein